MPDQTLDVTAIRERLGLEERYAEWLAELAALPVPEHPPQYPDLATARNWLLKMAVPAHQVEEALTTWSAVQQNAALRWMLDRCAWLLISQMGDGSHLRGWPGLPADLGTVSRYAYVWTFLAVLPAVRAYQQARGIPDDIAWATLADMGSHMSVYERAFGVGGLNSQNWLVLHFRGSIFQLGRLQFHRATVHTDPEVLTAANAPFQAGDPVLGVHIPDSGPMTVEGCSDSFRQAKSFFAQHFPETPYHYATCSSWLLDDQLADYLSADSNIVQFQRRFHLVPGGHDGNDGIIWFVFRRRGVPIDELPQRTTLERAIVSHIRAGHTWRSRSGWLAL